jgi:hypothetical protein
LQFSTRHSEITKEMKHISRSDNTFESDNTLPQQNPNKESAEKRHHPWLRRSSDGTGTNVQDSLPSPQAHQHPFIDGSVSFDSGQEQQNPSPLSEEYLHRSDQTTPVDSPSPSRSRSGGLFEEEFRRTDMSGYIDKSEQQANTPDSSCTAIDSRLD